MSDSKADIDKNSNHSKGGSGDHDSNSSQTKNYYFSPSTSSKNLPSASFGRRKDRFNPYNKSTYAKKTPNHQKDPERFRYGNYHQYYGYRNQGQLDNRLTCMKRDWFSDKAVLDVGCNAGHFTLSIAKELSPKFIIGVDIDNDLVKMAMKNVRHYLSREAQDDDDDFPLCFILSYGPIALCADSRKGYHVGKFPYNVQFIQGNYILPSDDFLEYQEAYFDTILCLSLTKWVHLNWGDDGIKKLFHRMFSHLNPGGHMLLEAQAFNTYSRRKKICADASRHYQEIKLRPEMFNEYLLKEVGFATCELIDIPAHSAKGFKRPIYLFTKSEDCAELEKPKCAKPMHIIYEDLPDDNRKDSDIEELSD